MILAKPKETLETHNKELIKRAEALYILGYIGSNQLEILKKMCEAHDQGKDNKYFKSRVDPNQPKKNFDVEKEINHQILSVLLLTDREDKNFIEIATAVLFHHNHIERMGGCTFETLKDLEDSKIVDNIGHREYEKLTRKQIKMIGRTLQDESTAVLRGQLMRCDHAASAGVDIDTKNDFLVDRVLNFMKKHRLRELQEWAKENRDINIVGIAGTGAGKTEAGLLWIGNNKGFFTLPLQTSLNALFKRLVRDLNLTDQEVTLLHANSRKILEELEFNSKNIKMLNKPLAISTIDQVLDIAFKYHSYEMKLAALSTSKLVLDEIQMYDPQVLAYIITALKQATRVGMKFAILTATFPPILRKFLKDAELDFEEKVVADSRIRHRLKVIKTRIDADFIADKAVGKTLVVCNTVKKAREIAESLEGKGLKVKMLHSRFTKEDRSLLEAEILEDGKLQRDENNNLDLDNEKEIIWVATQVVEASLDIDFSCLFTELSDLNGLFQRLGRVNRAGERGTDTYNCFVFTEIGNEREMIDQDIHELSKTAIKDHEGIITEQQKLDMIDQALTKENLEKSNFMKKYKDTIKYAESFKVHEKTKADARKELRNIENHTVAIKSLLEYRDIEDSTVSIYSYEYEKLRKKGKLEEKDGYIIADIEYCSKKGLLKI